MVYKIPNKRNRISIREISNTWYTRYQINVIEYQWEKSVKLGLQDTKYKLENTNKRNW